MGMPSIGDGSGWGEGVKALITTQPGLGHLHPMAPVAQALRQSDWEVAFACAPSFCPTVETIGFHAFPAGLDWLEREAERAFPELQGMSLEQQQRWFVTDLFADIAAQRMLPSLMDICRSWKPDVLLRNDFEFAACVAAECLGIPHATIGIEFLWPAHEWQALVGEKLACLSSACEIRWRSVVDLLHRYLYLSCIPPSYQFPGFTRAPVVHFMRPPVFDVSGDEGLPAWVSQLPSRPTVYVTLGTVFNRATGVFRTILEGLSQEPVNVILAVGRNQDPKELGAKPANVHIERYIPQTLIFPYCDLVITHGGFNTMMSALSCGLPVLVIPLSSHHPFHASRCADLEVGLALRRQGRFKEHLDGRYPVLSSETVRDAVRELLRDPLYRQNAQRLEREIISLPGPGKAVDLLTKLVVTRVPQVAATV